MSSPSENPSLPLRLRGLALAGTLALLAVGLSLYFEPATVQPLWPWTIDAFSSFFLGAVCLAALSALSLMLFYGRWWPARLVLPMLVIFSGGVLIVSLLNIRSFHFDRWSAWLWFVLLLALPALPVEYLWRNREQPPPEAYPTPPAWSRLLQTLGLVLGLYGIGLFLLPAFFGAFWPWPVDSFSGQLYSVVFTTAALGALGLSQWAAPVERLALGVSYSILGLFTLFSVLIANATQPQVDWGAFGVWVWMGLFAALFLVGLAMIWWSSGQMQGRA